MRLARFVFISSIKIITIQTQLNTFTIGKIIKISQQCFKGIKYEQFMIQQKNGVGKISKEKKPNKKSVYEFDLKKRTQTQVNK